MGGKSHFYNLTVSQFDHYQLWPFIKMTYVAPSITVFAMLLHSIEQIWKGILGIMLKTRDTNPSLSKCSLEERFVYTELQSPNVVKFPQFLIFC